TSALIEASARAVRQKSPRRTAVLLPTADTCALRRPPDTKRRGRLHTTEFLGVAAENALGVTAHDSVSATAGCGEGGLLRAALEEGLEAIAPSTPVVRHATRRMRDSNAETPSRSSPPRSYTLATPRQKPGGTSVLSPGHRRCDRTAGCPATTLRSEHRSGRGNAYRLPREDLPRAMLEPEAGGVGALAAGEGGGGAARGGAEDGVPPG